jgi:DNA-binding response OmpR family regulator
VPSPDQEPGAPGGRVLLVDDSDLVLSFFGDRLREFGFDVTAIQSGEQAIELATNGEAPFDLFVLDVVMPGMDGYEVAKWLRRHPKTRPTGILFLTSLADDDPAAGDANETTDHVMKALEAGADDFIGKSSSDEELRARCHALMELGRKRARQK